MADTKKIVMCANWPLDPNKPNDKADYGSTHDLSVADADRLLRAGKAVNHGSPAAAEIEETLKASKAKKPAPAPAT